MAELLRMQGMIIVIAQGLASLLLAGCASELEGDGSGSNPHGIAPEAWTKFDASLRKAITDAGPEGKWPVMVVLKESGDRPALGKDRPNEAERREHADRNRRAFEQVAADVVEALERAGAGETETYWINRTVSTLAPLPALEAVGRRAEVEEVILASEERVIIE